MPLYVKIGNVIISRPFTSYKEVADSSEYALGGEIVKMTLKRESLHERFISEKDRKVLSTSPSFLIEAEGIHGENVSAFALCDKEIESVLRSWLEFWMREAQNQGTPLLEHVKSVILPSLLHPQDRLAIPLAERILLKRGIKCT